MDPWSSPWNDDDASTASSQPAREDESATSIANDDLDRMSLPIETSDPWSNPSHPPALHVDIHQREPQSDRLGNSSARPVLEKLPSSTFAVASSWNPALEPSGSVQPQHLVAESTTPIRQTGSSILTASTGESDPWSSTPRPLANHLLSDGGAHKAPDASPNQAEAASIGDVAPASTWATDAQGWHDSAASGLNTPPARFAFPGEEPRTDALTDEGWALTPAQTDPSYPYSSSQAETAVRQDEDVWAAAATQKFQRGTQLSYAEVDELKLGARRMVTAANDPETLAAAFRMDLAGEEGWKSLFGPDGTKTDTLQLLKQLPGGLLKEDEPIIAQMKGNGQVTLAQTREAVRRTEDKTVKLATSEGSSVWKRRSKVLPKPEWEADGTISSNSSVAVFQASSARASMDQESQSTSGPGWFQTSTKEAKAPSGSGLFANLFKSRSSAAEFQRSSTTSVGSLSPRTSMDQSAKQPVQRPESTINVATALPAADSASALQMYEDERGSRYTDDPSGPDLMQVDQGVEPADKVPATVSKEEYRPSILSRWKNRNFFGTGSRSGRPSTSLASGGDLNEEDLSWLDGKPANYASYTDDDDSTTYDDSFDANGSSSYARDERPRKERLSTHVNSLMDANEEWIQAVPNASATSELATHLDGNQSAQDSTSSKLQSASSRIPSSSGATEWPDFDWDKPHKPQSNHPSIDDRRMTTVSAQTQTDKGAAVSGDQAAAIPAMRISDIATSKEPAAIQGSAAGRLPPPPTSTRFSLPPPPRLGLVNSVASSGNPGPSTVTQIPIFADFEQAPRISGPATVTRGKPARAASRLSQGNTLTADDLSFFDNL